MWIWYDEVSKLHANSGLDICDDKNSVLDICDEKSTLFLIGTTLASVEHESGEFLEIRSGWCETKYTLFVTGINSGSQNAARGLRQVLLRRRSSYSPSIDIFFLFY